MSLASAVARALCLVLALAAAAEPAELTIDAPPPLAAAAARIRAIDLSQLEADLRRAGLQLPERIAVVLLPERRPARTDHSRVGGRPRRRPAGRRDPPAAGAGVPYDSIESVFRHEVAHLALSARARGRPLPRWFHEGVATSVDAGWDLSGQLRLLFEMSKGPGTADLGRLFSAGSQPDAALAYALSAALVADLQRRHGAGVAGEIAAHVGEGVSFVRAFALVTGEAPDAAAARAWSVYRRWTAWVPALTGGTAVWAAILGLAAAAYAVRRRRRAQRRRQWDDED